MNKTKKSRSGEIAELFDSRFRIPNTDIRFGIDPIIGIFPGVGDWIGGAVSLYFLISATLLGAKAVVLGRMFVIVMVDILVGAIPVVGDVFDIYWKANMQNARILDELRENPRETTVASRLWVWLVLIQFIALALALLIFIGWLVVKLMELIF